jgi:hypothetical protein
MILLRLILGTSNWALGSNGPTPKSKKENFDVGLIVAELELGLLFRRVACRKRMHLRRSVRFRISNEISPVVLLRLQGQTRSKLYRYEVSAPSVRFDARTPP